MTIAWLLALLASAAAGQGYKPGPALTRIEAQGYEQCHSDMKGHYQRQFEIRVCQYGNGTYVDHERVLDAVSSKDWFPHRAFRNIVGEVRIICRVEGTFPGALRPRILLPSREDPSRRARVEIPCGENAQEAAATLSAAQRLLHRALKDPARISRQALAASRCKGREKEEACRRHAARIMDTFARKGVAKLEGAPFWIAFAGFEIEAGEPVISRRSADDTDSADPVLRLKALLRKQGRDAGDVNSEEIGREIHTTFQALAEGEKDRFVDEAVDDPDPTVRGFALERGERLSKDRLRSAVNRALDDRDGAIRRRVIRFVPELGEFYILRVLRDPDAGVRQQALDTIVDHFGDANMDSRAVPYLEQARSDPDPSVRDFAEGKLLYMREKK